jgi:hypothetical protein
MTQKMAALVVGEICKRFRHRPELPSRDDTRLTRLGAKVEVPFQHAAEVGEQFHDVIDEAGADGWVELRSSAGDLQHRFGPTGTPVQFGDHRELKDPRAKRNGIAGQPNRIAAIPPGVDL